MRPTTLLAAGAVALAGLGLVNAPTAQARDGDLITRGRCSAASTWKLKAGPRDGGLEVDFEVDTNRVGQTWNVRLLQNEVVVFRGSRVTQAPSGSFSVERRLADLAGTDRIVGRATNPATGEVCVGRLAV